MERSLNVWINDTCIGTLRESRGLWAFSYSQAWLTQPSAYPLCPLLPLQTDPLLDGASRRPVQWFFDNLLPEEGQRQLIARSTGVAIEDAFALLEHYGAESAGSLTLLPPTQTPAPGQVQSLTTDELSSRIRNMPTVPLAATAAKKMSLAGAQHKMAVILENGELLEPVGSEPSSHILKPEHSDPAWSHSVINEWFIMTLAGRLGLPVPKVHRLYVPQPVFLVDRFDRAANESNRQRLHCIDACQMTGLAREFKYSAGSIERLAELVELCRTPVVARLQLFQWLVFNVLAGNEDAHLKNLSFLMSNRQASLAPFYDLLCTAVYSTRAFNRDSWPEGATLAWPILGVQHLVDISPALLIEAGEHMGIKPTTARDNIRRMVKAILPTALQLLEEVIEENQQLSLTRPELRATLAGEARLLRSICYTIIRDMTERLA